MVPILVFQIKYRGENPDSHKYVIAKGIRIDRAFVRNLW